MMAGIWTSGCWASSSSKPRGSSCRLRSSVRVVFESSWSGLILSEEKEEDDEDEEEDDEDDMEGESER